MYGLVALAQRGKRPCTHLIDTLWKRCWPASVCLIDAMLSFVTTLVHVSRIAARYLPERLHARTMHVSLAVLALTCCRSCRRVCLCACQDFTNCRFLMVFLCCQALLQDAGAHGQRASQTLNFGGPLSLLPELFDVCFMAFSILQTHLHILNFFAG